MVTAVPPAEHTSPPGGSGKQLRVAHVTATFPPYASGTGLVAYHNALQLASRGHSIRVVCAGAQPRMEQPVSNLTVRQLKPWLRVGNAPFAPNLAHQLYGCDVLHLHYPFYFGAEQVWWTHIRTGIPYVITYHQDVIFQGALAVLERLHHRISGRRILSGARWV